VAIYSHIVPKKNFQTVSLPLFFLFFTDFQLLSSLHYCDTILVTFTSGLGGRPGARPCSPLWAGASARIPAALLGHFGRPGFHAADLSCCCCRATAAQTTRAGAAMAWVAAAEAVQGLWGGLSFVSVRMRKSK
jgi:hypothetical protein